LGLLSTFETLLWSKNISRIPKHLPLLPRLAAEAAAAAAAPAAAEEEEKEDSDETWSVSLSRVLAYLMLIFLQQASVFSIDRLHQLCTLTVHLFPKYTLSMIKTMTNWDRR